MDPANLTVVFQKRLKYAEESVMGVRIRKPGSCSNSGGNEVILVGELTRIELATS
jgi:hypothetical protein